MAKLTSAAVLTVANVWLAIATNSSILTLGFFKSGIGAHLIAYWVQYYFSAIALALVLLLYWQIDRRKRLDAFVKHVLDLAVEFDVKDSYDDELCRATVYRFRRISFLAFISYRQVWGEFRMPWAGWLVPVSRSGAHSIPVIGQTVFRASRVQCTKGDYHGVTGAIWSKGKHVFSAEPTPTDGRKQRAHAQSTAKKMFLTDREYQRRLASKKTLSPYIYGRRIDISGDRCWGVVVFDLPAPPKVLEAGAGHQTSDQLVVGVLARAIEGGMS